MTIGVGLLLVALLHADGVHGKPTAQKWNMNQALMFLQNARNPPNCIPKYDDDECRNVTQLITSKGYPCEEHFVTTPDGFILSLQRIPSGREMADGGSREAPRRVVFLQHGLLDSSATWVMNLAHQSLGFILADAGFDVWLGNMRGNTYSRHHVKYETSDAEFWQWSWDQMANYDLPSMLNYVLMTTGQQQLFYVGHSQGTLIAFSRLSHDKELAKKVKAYIALGPVATVGHIRGLLEMLVGGVAEEKFIFDLFGVHEFLPSNELMRLLASELCSHVLLRYFCENFVFLISGFDYRQFNATRMPVYFSHTPAGTSVQNMVHFAQMVKSKLCQAYDYGSPELNFEHYNQSRPPVYDVSQLSVPTYIFSGNHDFLADPEDVDELMSQLQCVVSHVKVYGWQHLDFIWSLDAATNVYTQIVKIFQQHSDEFLG